MTPIMVTTTIMTPNQMMFFFFKQKTAYEITASDWSSDVCSSDLGPLVGVDATAVVEPRPVALEVAGRGRVLGEVAADRKSVV